jgi:hypothetical protein
MIVGGLFLNFQSFGVAQLTLGIPNFVDGFIGFGPDGLTSGSVQNQGIVETVMSNLKSQGEIGSNVLGVFFHAEPGTVSFLSSTIRTLELILHDNRTRAIQMESLLWVALTAAISPEAYSGLPSPRPLFTINSSPSTFPQ